MRLSIENFITIALYLSSTIAAPIGLGNVTSNSNSTYTDIRFRKPAPEDDIVISLPQIPSTSSDSLDGVVPVPVDVPLNKQRQTFTIPKDLLIIDPERETQYEITIPVEPKEDGSFQITLPFEPNSSTDNNNNDNDNNEKHQLSKRGIVMAVPRFLYYCHLFREFGHVPWQIAQIPDRILLHVVDKLVEAYKDEEPMMDQGEKLLKKVFKSVMGPLKEELNLYLDGMKMDTNYFIHYFLRADISRVDKLNILVCLLADLDVPDVLLPKEWPDYIKEREYDYEVIDEALDSSNGTVSNSTLPAIASALI
ncbi:putative secreted protein [Wickerhamomyces ciferrii]|uniref:Secreted protein n=1 Tax=Wickerhamomyces ciferrii (strain ATCC 14091 / BCRC 22168 / CBS 111 / JCM 3599 / NBRC 0793 / NRRL Y-1031 F-60-10) TaxID=1206466 RepID=K0KIT6_WICCF|nr:uncharacterized protein BN7_1616 [Wickerhamomyces ciferrii]CCH42077.1 putative secreted protein [Wickerhamomyces ciferrii]